MSAVVNEKPQRGHQSVCVESTSAEATSSNEGNVASVLGALDKAYRLIEIIAHRAGLGSASDRDQVNVILRKLERRDKAVRFKHTDGRVYYRLK